jgi:hypothetical protein
VCITLNFWQLQGGGGGGGGGIRATVTSFTVRLGRASLSGTLNNKMVTATSSGGHQMSAVAAIGGGSTLLVGLGIDFLAAFLTVIFGKDL